MADCFSLPNAQELANAYRNADRFDGIIRVSEQIADITADAIEALAQENAKLKAERDAAVADLKSIAPCQKCKHFGVNQMTCDALEKCLYGEEQAWEWRGVTDTNVGSKKEEEDATN